ncbi:MAG TPA: hypothetical protein VLM89_09385 [Phycisphaerae bacterium]|nr:hypothetical protein [Phycisphaerae bacterium]
MNKNKTRRTIGLAILALGCCGGFLDGCAGNLQRELEVLAAPESNPTLIRDSVLVDWFGPQAIKFFQKWW